MEQLAGTVTQAAFGAHVGITQQAVSDLIARGVLRHGDTGDVWRLAYCEHLRQVSAGRDPDGELSTERARLARENADRVAMLNARTRREQAPIAMLELVLAATARQIATRLDSVVPSVRRLLPDLPPAALQLLANEIHVCRELCAATNLAQAERLQREGDEDEPDIDDTQDEAA